MQIFVSSYNVGSNPNDALIGRLRREGWPVDHSPLDSDWKVGKNWYSEGLPAAIAKADVFIIVVEPYWDRSTWMAQEAWEAMETPHRRHVPHLFYWNPLHTKVRAAGVKHYLRERLPDDLDGVVSRLRVVTLEDPVDPFV